MLTPSKIDSEMNKTKAEIDALTSQIELETDQDQKEILLEELHYSEAYLQHLSYEDGRGEDGINDSVFFANYR